MAQVKLLVSQRAEGKRREIGLEATTAAEAARLAERSGWQVHAVLTGERIAAAQRRSGSPRGFSLELFSQELLVLLEAGLQLPQALETLRDKEERTAVRALLEELLVRLGEGLSLSDTLGHHPEIFPELYVALVRASERSGNLPSTLRRYVHYGTQLQAVRHRIVSTSIYPALLLIVGGAVVLFMLGYVVPRFSMVYQDGGRELPLLSSLLLHAGRLVQEHWAIIGTALALTAVSVGLLLGRHQTRAWLGHLLLRLPGLARRSTEFRLSRCYRTLAILLRSGIPLAQALRMCDSLFQGGEARRLERARQAMMEGQTLSQALETEKLLTPVARSLVRVGERSGRLDAMLERSAQFHDEALERWLDRAARLLEPLLMTLLGLVIGLLVFLLYLPIFELAGSLS